jgi:phosphatidylglycerophosphate synthase
MNAQDFKSIVHKGSDENYLLDMYLFRRISWFGSWMLSKTGLSPNLVTLVSLLFALAAVPLFASRSPWLNILGCLAAFTYHYLDHVDGELARYYASARGRSAGLSGSYFDVLCHSFSVNLWLLAIAFSCFQSSANEWFLVLGVMGMLGFSSFERLVACRVYVINLSQRPELMSSVPAREALALLDNRSRQVEDAQSPPFSSRWLKKLVKELVSYPGIISLIIIGVAIDAVLETHIGRLTVLVVGFARVGFSVRGARRNIRSFSLIV